jgi:NTE family protein
VSTAHNLDYQGMMARKLWEKVRADNIYLRQAKAFVDFLSSGGKGILLNFIKKNENKKSLPHFRGFLDTEPFLPFLKSLIDWSQITKNIDSGLVRALSISTTNVFTGQLELFIQKHPDTEYTGEYITHMTKVRAEHVKASAAIPLIFPTVMINGIAYTDGGLRLNTPMSPAIQLGADSIFVIGLHHRPKDGKIPFHGKRGEPASVGQVLGRVMNSIFIDRTQYDMEQLARINAIIEWTENVYGKDYLKKLNRMLKRKKISGDVANRGLKKLNVLRITPSENIGEIFGRSFRKHKERYFTTFEKFLVRIMDVDPTRGVDLLSYIAFIPDYLKNLIDLGFEDAHSHRKEIIEFLER